MDEFIILKIENSLYRLPRGVLTSYSEFFRDMFSSEFSTGLKQDSKELEGTLDSCPIVFEQVLQKDFDRLLSLIIDGSRLNTSETNTWSATDWVPVLTLADKWQMPKVKRLALGTLKKVAPPHIKIAIGKKFEDKLLIQSGLVDLCTRVEPITENEAKEIGFEAAMKCAAIREKLWMKYFTLEKEGTHRLPRSQTRGFAKVAHLHATESSPVLRNEESPESGLPPTSFEPAMTQLSSTNSEIDDKSVRDNDTSYTESLAASSYVADDMSEKTISATAARIVSLSPGATAPTSAAATVIFPSSRNSQEDRPRWGRPPVAANRVSGDRFPQPRIMTPINDALKVEFEEDDFAHWLAPYPGSEHSVQVRTPAHRPPLIVPSQSFEPWGVNKTARTRVQDEPQPWETEDRKYFSSWCNEGTVPRRRSPPRPIVIRSPVSPWPISPELPPRKDANRNSFDNNTFSKGQGVSRRDPSPRRKTLHFEDESVDNNYNGGFGDDSWYNSGAGGAWATTRRSPSPPPIQLEESKGFFIPPLFGNPKGFFLKFHELLRPGAKKLDWNATRDPYGFAYRRNGSHVERLHIETYIESLPATQPPIKAMCLILDEATRFVRVEPFGPNAFVTIGMVLNHIYEQLVMVPAAEDWFDLADGKYPYRMKAIANKKRAEKRANFRAPPLKWGDMLEGKVYFGGIVDFVEKPFHGGDLPTFVVTFEE